MLGAVNRCSRQRETDEQLCDDLGHCVWIPAIPKAAPVALNLFLGLGTIRERKICRRLGDPCRPICLRRQDAGRGTERSCHAYPVDAQNYHMLNKYEKRLLAIVVAPAPCALRPRARSLLHSIARRNV